jgi:ribosome-associated translation inhibitor RaiA
MRISCSRGARKRGECAGSRCTLRTGASTASDAVFGIWFAQPGSMSFPVQITFRELQHSEAIEADIRRKAEEFDKYFDRITYCRVSVEGPGQHHRNGQHYHVTIELGVPGQELVVSRDPVEHAANESMETAIRDAFRSLRRELQSYVGRRHQQERSDSRIEEDIAAG